MEDWLSTLSEQEQKEWDEYVRHAREEMVPKMEQSAFVMSLVPNKVDIKFAVELGMAIMLDKPIMAVVQKGLPIPEKMRRVAEEIVEIDRDMDTEEGREEASFKIAAAVSRMVKRASE